MARITAGLLLAVVVISLGYLFHSGFGGSATYLFNGEVFTPSEQHAMEVAFAKAGLTVPSSRGEGSACPAASRASMSPLATGNALPRNFGDLLEKVLSDSNPFRPQSIVGPAIETAKMKELSQIIGSMNGIDDATVMFGSQTEPGLLKKITRTASVTVKPRGSGSLTAELADFIRSMVASAMAIDRANIAGHLTATRAAPTKPGRTSRAAGP